MMIQDWEALAAEKARLWEAEVNNRKLIAQIPRRRHFWWRWLGHGMVLVGGWFTGWGVWLAQCEESQRVIVASNSSNA
jgi:hypothetical protein